MGFFEILSVKNPPPPAEIDEPHTKFIRFVSDTDVRGEFARVLKETIGDLANTKIEGRSLYEAIVEAMQNVIHHAYSIADSDDVKKIHRRWWMTGAYHSPTHQLQVVFYDLGVGIPATLPAKHGVEQIRKFLASLGLVNNDANLIYAAMELGRSGTGLAHRGKGLQQIKALVDDLGPGKLRIMSGRGELIYDSSIDDPNEANKYTKVTHSQHLEGTLIQWELVLPDKESVEVHNEN